MSEPLLTEVTYQEKRDLFPGAKGLPNAGRFLEECVQHLTRRIFEMYLGELAGKQRAPSAPCDGHLAVFCPAKGVHVRGKYTDEDVEIFRFSMDFGLSEESALASCIHDAIFGSQSACLMFEVE